MLNILVKRSAIHPSYDCLSGELQILGMMRLMSEIKPSLSHSEQSANQQWLLPITTVGSAVLGLLMLG